MPQAASQPPAFSSSSFFSGLSTSFVSTSRYAPFSGELSRRDLPLRFQNA